MPHPRFRRAFALFPALFLAACQSSKDPVVARVGGSPITLHDLETRLQQTPAQYQHYVSTLEGRRQFLDILIREKILLQGARRVGLQNESAYRQAVEKFEADWKRQVQEYKDSLLVDSYLKRLRVKELAVSDADVERYYNDHRSEYEHPVELLVSHILVGSEADAEQVLDRLKKGESFESLATELSKDPATAARGGKLAPFRHGTLPPEFEAAAFALHTGQVSKPAKTQFGFHIIKKLGERALAPESVEQARESIRARLERDKFNEWVTARQAALGVHVDEQAMSRLAVNVSTQEPSSL